MIGSAAGRRLSAITVLLFFVPACSSEPAPSAAGDASVAAETTLVEPSDSDSPVPTLSPTPDSRNPEVARVTPSVEPSPVDEQRASPQSPLDLAIGALIDPEALSEAYDEAYRTHAETVTLCMRSEGFEYVYPQLQTPQPSEFVVGANSDTDLVRRFGYGPPRTVAGLVEARQDLATEADAGESNGPAHGSPLRASFLESKARCLDEAADAIRLPDELPVVVAEVVQEFRESLADSTAVRAIWADWSRCMAEQGYGFVDRTAVSESLYSSAIPLQQAIAALQPREELDPAIVQQLDALLESERAIVEADVGCATTATTDERLAAVRSEAELAFLEENGDWIKLEMNTWRSSG